MIKDGNLAHVTGEFFMFSAAEEEGDAGASFTCPQGSGDSPCAPCAPPMNFFILKAQT